MPRCEGENILTWPMWYVGKPVGQRGVGVATVRGRTGGVGHTGIGRISCGCARCLVFFFLSPRAVYSILSIRLLALSISI